MRPITHLLLGAVLLALSFLHPFFIILFVGYLFFVNSLSEESVQPTLHGRDLSTLDEKALYV